LGGFGRNFDPDTGTDGRSARTGSGKLQKQFEAINGMDAVDNETGDGENIAEYQPRNAGYKQSSDRKSESKRFVTEEPTPEMDGGGGAVLGSVVDAADVIQSIIKSRKLKRVSKEIENNEVTKQEQLEEYNDFDQEYEQDLDEDFGHGWEMEF
jgi:cyclophilin family peptidyl-prolyl cis-trans isomerase